MKLFRWNTSIQCESLAQIGRTVASGRRIDWSTGAPLSEVWVWKLYEAHRQGTAARGTLRWLVGQYLDSAAFAAKAKATQKQYLRASKQVLRMPLKDGTPFGDATVRGTTPGTVRGYMDKRSDVPVQANRELAFLSVAFAWARERDLCKDNPCIGVRRYNEKPRNRYITDVEYQFVYELAAQAPSYIQPAYIQPAMEIAYLCRMRKSEVLALRREHLLEEGLDVHRLKGSKDQIIGWSPRLRAAVEATKATRGPIAGVNNFLFGGREPLHVEAFNAAWQRLMKRAMVRGLKERFTFHDIKAKGVSDFDGDKRKAAGHRTLAMADTYASLSAK